MKRYDEIDSLRGIAALTVIISHGLAIFALPGNLLDITPLYFFWSSHEAVIFFFVLSGFVLTLPFLNREIKYFSYLIKRVLRIYLPYMVAVCFTFFSYFLFSKMGNLNGLGTWVQTKWTEDPSVVSILQHFLLLGNFETTTYNPAIWSLVQEMRISIIFPLLVLLVVKWKTKHVIAIGITLSLIGCSNVIFEFQSSAGNHTSLFDTLHYIFMFLIGSILAKNKALLILQYQNYSHKFKVVIIIMAFGFYLYSRVAYMVPHLFGYELITEIMTYIRDWGIAIGAGMFIIIAISSEKIAGYLRGRLLSMNGKLSYSTYLYHSPILLVLFSVFNGLLNHWITFALSIVLTYLFAYLSWKFIELPSIKIGRKIDSKINRTKVKEVNVLEN